LERTVDHVDRGDAAEVEEMKNADGGKTSPRLLNRVGDWGDHAAWVAFFSRYDAELRGWCRRFQLDDDTCDELLQRVWIELSRRMRTFRYDPGRSFRGWLWRLLRSRALDLLKEREKAKQRLIGEYEVESLRRCLIQECPSELDVPVEEPESARPELLVMAVQVQERVRSAVTSDSWRAFELVAIEDRPLREAGRVLGKSKAATFAAQKRVKERLRAEGRRVLNGRVGPRIGANDPAGTTLPG
jgi:RNA polymerase sigma factor (sigma-70 family)